MGITLDEAREHAGEGVVYQVSGGVTEYGTISSVGEKVVFVLYAGDRCPKATDPASLTLASLGGGQ
jgi:hypothetical protein